MKGTKIWLILALLLIVAGGSIMAVGISMGGYKSMAFDWKQFRFVDAETTYIEGEVQTEEFSGIHLEIVTADVEVCVGDKYMVEYRVPENVVKSIEVKDGVLNISEKEENSAWYNFNIIISSDNRRYIKITVPKKELESCSIELVTGDVTFKGIDFGGKIELVTGDVEISDGTLSDIIISGTTSDVKCDNITVGTAEISVVTGDVKLGIAGDIHDGIGYKLATVTGDVKVGGDDMGSVYSSAGEGDRLIGVSATTGDIVITGN